MRVLVVFESMFGNTERVARAVAEGLAEHATVEVANVDVVADDPLPDVDLVVVGGPTHAFGLSRPSTRQDAAARIGGSLVSERRGLREWLESQGKARRGVAAAAFCTRAREPRWLPGSAARGVSRRLRRHGYRLVARPEDFYVDDLKGPVTTGEIDRARRWGADLGATRLAR